MPDDGPPISSDRRGPIFIIGAMGSGTTLLRLMLDSHERIGIPHETGFMRAYKAMQFIPFKWTGYGWAYRLGWSAEEFDAELATFFERIFRRYADEHGKARWGEKTPLHTWHVTAMRRLFPDAQFIAVVRHPGASTASNMRRFHHSANRMALHWDRYNREIGRHAKRLPEESFALLRYEDLVRDPERSMRDLLAWLGEPWSDRVLEHHVVQAEREHDRIEGQSRADDPIDASRLERWATTMEQADRELVTRRVGRLGEFFGYSMADPAVLEPLNDPPAPLVGLPDVLRRAEAFADLDLDTRPDVPIFEHFYNPRRFWLVQNETGEPPIQARRAEEPPPPASRLRSIARRLPPRTRRRLKRAAARLR